MRQFTLVKVLTFSALFLANFSTFAMETEKRGAWDAIREAYGVERLKVYHERLLSLKRNDKKKYDANEIQKYKNSLLDKYKRRKKKYTLKNLIKEYGGIDRLSFDYLSPVLIPGSVLLKIIEIGIIDESFNRELRNGFKPLHLLAKKGDIVKRYADESIIDKNYPNLPYIKLYFNILEDIKSVRFERTKTIVLLLKNLGLKKDLEKIDKEGKTAHCIAKEQLELGYVTKAFADIFFPKPKPKPKLKRE